MNKNIIKILLKSIIGLFLIILVSLTSFIIISYKKDFRLFFIEDRIKDVIDDKITDYLKNNNKYSINYQKMNINISNGDNINVIIYDLSIKSDKYQILLDNIDFNIKLTNYFLNKNKFISVVIDKIIYDDIRQFNILKEQEKENNKYKKIDFNILKKINHFLSKINKKFINQAKISQIIINQKIQINNILLNRNHNKYILDIDNLSHNKDLASAICSLIIDYKIKCNISISNLEKSKDEIDNINIANKNLNFLKNIEDIKLKAFIKVNLDLRKNNISSNIYPSIHSFIYFDKIKYKNNKYFKNNILLKYGYVNFSITDNFKLLKINDLKAYRNKVAKENELYLKMLLNNKNKRIKIGINMNEIYNNDIHGYWPLFAKKSTKIKKYIHHAIQDDKLSAQNIEMQIDVNLKNKKLNQFNMNFDFLSDNFNFHNKFPNVKLAIGKVSINKDGINHSKDKLNINIDKAKIANSNIKDINIYMSNFRKKKLFLHIKTNNIKSNIKDILKISNLYNNNYYIIDNLLVKDLSLSNKVSASMDIAFNIKKNSKYNFYEDLILNIDSDIILNSKNKIKFKLNKINNDKNIAINFDILSSPLSLNYFNFHKDKNDFMNIISKLNIDKKIIKLNSKISKNQDSMIIDLTYDRFNHIFNQLDITNNNLIENSKLKIKLNNNIREDNKIDKKINIYGNYLNIDDIVKIINKFKQKQNLANKQKIKEKQNKYNNSLEFDIKIDKLKINSDYILSNIDINLNCSNDSNCDDSHIKADNFINKIPEFNIKIINNKKEVANIVTGNILLDNIFKYILKIDNISNLNFKIDGNMTYNDYFNSDLEIKNPKKSLIKYINKKDKILLFDNLYSKINLNNNLLTIDKFIIYNNIWGITNEGKISLDNIHINLGGTIIPAYYLNNIFILDKIPVLNKIFSFILNDGQSKSLLSFTYKYNKKNINEAGRLDINPISILTPNLIKRLLSKYD